MRAQARALTPLQLRQEQQSNTDLRCSQELCAGAGLPDSRTVENLRGTLSIPPEFRLDNVGIGAAHGGKSTIAARQKTVQTCIRPSVGVDHPLAEGVMRWIDGTTERKLRSVLQNPNTNCQALCRARTFRLQGEGICVKQQAEPPRIGRVAWCAGSCRNNTRKTGGSHALTGTPPKSGGTAVRRVPEAGGAACAHAGERTPSSVLFPRHDRRGLLSGNLVRRSGRIPLAESCGLRCGGSWGHPEFGEE